MSNASTGSGRRVLERTLGKLRRPARAAPAAGSTDGPGQLIPTDEAFRAVVDERLRSLERQLDEVKGRVNGLIFLLVGTVAAQFMLRLLG